MATKSGRTLWTREMSSVAGLAAGTEAVFVAATDGAFATWLPFDGDGPADCLAPITLE